jgi:hypothetical protein
MLVFIAILNLSFQMTSLRGGALSYRLPKTFVFGRRWERAVLPAFLSQTVSENSILRLLSEYHMIKMGFQRKGTIPTSHKVCVGSLVSSPWESNFALCYANAKKAIKPVSARNA